MVLRLVAMRRRADISPAAFRHHWLTVHGPLMAAVPGVRYVQNHVVDTAQRVAHARGPSEVDGFASIAFASDEAMRDAGKHPSAIAAGADLANFVGASTRMRCEVNTVVPPPPAGTGIKRMSLLYRKPGITDAEFRRFWTGEHAPLVAAYPGLLGYTQNIVTGTLSLPDPRIADAWITAAGVLEMRFASIEAMDAALASPEGRIAVKHGEAFLAAATTYVVKEIQIAP